MNSILLLLSAFFKKNKATLAVVSYVLLLCVIIVWTFTALFNARKEVERLSQNQDILLHNGNVEIFTADGKSAVSAPAVTISKSEFKASNEKVKSVAKSAGIKPSRINEFAEATSETNVEVTAPIEHQATMVNNHVDTASCIRYADPWVTLSGCVSDSVFTGVISSMDTLDIIVHRVPKRFLFFRFGCKEVRMDIVSRNPHTRLTHARFYQLVK